MHPTDVRPAEDRRLPTEDVARSAPLPHAYAPALCEQATVQAEVTRAYAMNVTAPRRARADTRMLVTALGWDGDDEDAVLAVSELVTNACRYTNAAGPELRVRLAVLDADALLVEVSDPLAGFAPSAAHPERGRGLPLLEQLATHVDWYLHGDGSGKTVRAWLSVLTPGCES
ncbi:ATP-binding protein [Streptomyces acidiscabies]|uniref:ATP-binding protein n=1 Tax=Streptomyces acidiscabies TaxID=42234 RepID=A0ABU4MAY0_9ACTN|nr:ATP-binding protein [Streptomyces acidiscabies]MDX3024977.1 ATP-binding protein [Streptomyces acidiscabies]